ncbi:MAG: hypothetical protein AAF993_00565 [Pseudomonadota bacterium]
MTSHVTDVTDLTGPVPAQHTRAVILLATNYSGSHLLSHLLGAHSACFSVGELHRLRKLLTSETTDKIKSDYACHPLFADLAASPPETWHKTLLQRYQLVHGDPYCVLIDNSKKPAWAQQVLATDQGLSPTNYQYIHLIRDPRALVARWSQDHQRLRTRFKVRCRTSRRSHKPQLLLARYSNILVHKWLTENHTIRQFLRQANHGAASASPVVTYHDMVFAPRRTLARLMPQLGLQPEVQQMQFGASSLKGTFKTAHEQSIRQSIITPDLRWQRLLPARTQQDIINHPDVRDLAGALGLKITPQGLSSVNSEP